MWMMQMTVNQIVKMITVWNALMCTAWAVYMSLVMYTTLVSRRTSIGICRVDLKDVFVNVIQVSVLQVAIMQIVGVAGVNDSHMAAGESVLMDVLLMLGA
jgi:hypothetical protein